MEIGFGCLVLGVVFVLLNQPQYLEPGTQSFKETGTTGQPAKQKIRNPQSKHQNRLIPIIWENKPFEYEAVELGTTT